MVETSHVEGQAETPCEIHSVGKAETNPVSETDLIKLGQKYLLNNEKQRERCYKYFQSKRNDAEFIEKMREVRRNYYYRHRETIRETMNNKYKEDVEYYNKIRAAAKEKYARNKKSNS